MARRAVPTLLAPILIVSVNGIDSTRIGCLSADDDIYRK